ncbi:MAG: hypothetical protein ACT4O2_08680 [Beijerinckiaceae bacterium]
MDVMYPRCAGLDVHKDSVFARVRCVSEPRHDEVAEVGQLADRQIIALDPRRGWATHKIGGETSQTVVWLIFDADRLQSAQLAWAYKLKRMHEGPPTDLCKS